MDRRQTALHNTSYSPHRVNVQSWVAVAGGRDVRLRSAAPLQRTTQVDNLQLRCHFTRAAAVASAGQSLATGCDWILCLSRVATLLKNLEKSGNWKVVREKSEKMYYYNYSVAAIVVQTVICDYNNSTIDHILFQPKYNTYTTTAYLLYNVIYVFKQKLKSTS